MVSNLDASIADLKKRKQKQMLFITMAGVVMILVTLVVFVVSNKSSGDLHQVNQADDTEFVATPHKDIEAERSEAQQALSETKQRIEEWEQNISFVQWSDGQLDAVSREMERAYKLYAQSHYLESKNAVGTVSDTLDDLIKNYDDKIRSLVTSAQHAFNNNEINLVRKLLGQLLSVDPENADAKKLLVRVEAFEKVQDLYGKLNTAQIENNVSKQQQLLEQIVQLDTEDKGAKNKLFAINKQLADEAFSNAYGKAYAAFVNQDLVGAEKYLNKASSIHSSRAELTLLKNKISNEYANQSLEKLEQQVSIFAQSDEWLTVQLIGKRALSQFPDSKKIQQTVLMAEAILNYEKKFSQYIARPQRLRDRNIQENARKAYTAASVQRQASPKLAQQGEKLLNLIDQENQPIEVFIESDNRTMIKVLGVGIVGKISNKIIELKPGKYEFEGTRDGYKTTIVSLNVERTDQPVKVIVVCTQRV